MHGSQFISLPSTNHPRRWRGISVYRRQSIWKHRAHAFMGLLSVRGAFGGGEGHVRPIPANQVSVCTSLVTDSFVPVTGKPEESELLLVYGVYPGPYSFLRCWMFDVTFVCFYYFIIQVTFCFYASGIRFQLYEKLLISKYVFIVVCTYTK